MPLRFREKHVNHRADYRSKPVRRQMGTCLEIFALTKSGKEIPIDISLSPLGDTGRVIAIIRDVTTAKDLQNVLKEKNTELESFNKLMVDRELKMIELKEKLSVQTKDKN